MRGMRVFLWFGLTGCTAPLPLPGEVAPTESSGTPVTLPDKPTGGVPTACAEGRDGAVCIDEVQSANDSTLQIAPGIFPDWVEIRNAGSTALELGRVWVQLGDQDPHPLAPGRSLSAGEVLLLWADGEDEEGHLPSALDADGELVRVWVDGVPTDELVVPELSGDEAFGRYGGVETVSCTPSPGVLNTGTAPCTDVRDGVFALGVVHDFAIEIDPANWAVLESSTTFDHPKAIAALAFDGGEFPAVEINLKGGYGSFRADLDSQKAGFKIDLNQYGGYNWRGLKKLTLNNMVQDPSFVHEYLTYFLYRKAGLPAPRVSYARVHVNGVYFGFYSFIETVDEPFLELWYGNSDGHLFESAYGPDFDMGEEGLFDYDNGPDEEQGVAAIVEVIDTLNLPWDESTYAQLRTQVDMDQWMSNMAVEAATWHWDGYWTENNNRMYHDPVTDRWTIIPHGTDQTWVDGWPNPYDVSSRPRLYDFCMAVESCRTLYGEKLLDLADVVDASPLEAHLDVLIAYTEPEFYADPRAEETGNHTSQLEGTRSRILSLADALRSAVP